ncbi:DNA polymerase IV [Candidatus Berkelbacteria bacterium]|nr:DNA polymerase IV [Candidatus Berkelbacteria bacterium]
MNKIIIHLDMNSYYATLEQQAYPNLRGKPIGVAGKGKGERTVIAGASIEAKKLGVKGAMSSWEALKICPSLIIIPANYERYSFVSKRIFNMLERFSPKVEIFSIDEAFIELPATIGWDGAEKIAKQMKQLISKQIGEWVTCSIGISYGKTLAKLASELQKPDGLVVIKPENFRAIAKITRIEELCGIGWRIGPRLNQIGVRTIAELGDIPKQILTTIFGEFTGSWLHRIGNGVDDNIIRSFHGLDREKSVGHSYTVPRDLTNIGDTLRVALLLSERIGVRLRRKELIGKTISVYIHFNDRTIWAESKIQPSYICDGLAIYEAAKRIIDNIPYPKPIRLVGISISNLVSQEQITQPLFTIEQKKIKLTNSVDKINERYGEFTVFRSSLAKIKQRIFNLPDGRNKRLFVPNATPFMKRLT